MPASIIIITGEEPRTRLTARTSATAASPAAKAESWTKAGEKPASMPSAAPNDAPVATPSVSGVARGFEKSDWKAAPETASPAPASIASATRGSRILRRTPRVSSAFSISPKNDGKSAESASPAAIGKRPKQSAAKGASASAAAQSRISAARLLKRPAPPALRRGEDFARALRAHVEAENFLIILYRLLRQVDVARRPRDIRRARARAASAVRRARACRFGRARAASYRPRRGATASTGLHSGAESRSRGASFVEVRYEYNVGIPFINLLHRDNGVRALRRYLSRGRFPRLSTRTSTAPKKFLPEVTMRPFSSSHDEEDPSCARLAG